MEAKHILLLVGLTVALTFLLSACSTTNLGGDATTLKEEVSQKTIDVYKIYEGNFFKRLASSTYDSSDWFSLSKNLEILLENEYYDLAENLLKRVNYDYQTMDDVLALQDSEEYVKAYDLVTQLLAQEPDFVYAYMLSGDLDMLVSEEQQTDDEIPIACVDPAGGPDEFVFDSVTGAYQDTPTDANVKHDSCEGADTDILFEAVCGPDGFITTQEINCEFGCEFGRCIFESEVEQPIPSYICEDSDGGQDSDVVGTVTGVYRDDPTTQVIVYDTCPLPEKGGPAAYITEYYCDKDGFIASVEMPCALGCEAGACTQPEIECTDTDGGSNEFTLGTVSGVFSDNPNEFVVLDDYCVTPKSDTPTYVVEYMCGRGDFITSSSIDCEFGCEDGACLDELVTTDDTNTTDPVDPVDDSSSSNTHHSSSGTITDYDFNSPIPTSSVNEGSYEVDDCLEVELSVDTTYTDMYYTLDGSEPTQDSAILYEQAICLEPGTKTLKYRSYKLGKIPSEVITKEFVITSTQQDVSPVQEVVHESVEDVVEPTKEKRGFFGSIGHFFKCLFSKAC